MTRSDTPSPPFALCVSAAILLPLTLSLGGRHVAACYASTTVAFLNARSYAPPRQRAGCATSALASLYGKRLWCSNVYDASGFWQASHSARAPPSPCLKQREVFVAHLCARQQRVASQPCTTSHRPSCDALRPTAPQATRPTICSSMTPRTIHAATTKPHASAMCCATAATATSPHRYTIPTLDHAHTLDTTPARTQDTTRTIGRTRSTRRRRSSSPTPPSLPPQYEYADVLPSIAPGLNSTRCVKQASL
ncbi:hypothetical protein C8R44DRAFT_91290 [Mycena epipterygia]|nr:hypothetical protein C8R44DRAFT_91290 [Mycena epipterygia]